MRCKLHIIILIIALTLSNAPNVFAESSLTTPASQEKTAIEKTIKSMAGPNDAVLLTNPSGKIIISKNAGKFLIPASTLKLLTSLAALTYLGPDFRFQTEFYVDPDQNLIIKGYGDPLLISEELKEIANALSTRVTTYKDLILDTSYFSEPLVIPGVTSSLEPYDSPNGALCVNFNTVFFQKDSAGNFVSAEPQTPLLPYVLPKIKRSGLSQGRILLSSEDEECVQYAGHLFQYFFSESGMSGSGKIRTGIADTSKGTLVYTHVSRFPLPAVVEQLLEFSNNFMANQLMLTLSAKQLSPPGTLDKEVRVLSEFAKAKLGIEKIKLAEGSGISRKNSMTANDMAKILKAFLPYHHLLRKENHVYYKTGHLNGIRTRAGYIEDTHGNLLPFVIFVNTPNKSDKKILNQLIRLTAP